ncbi:MAG: hypothetical protein V4561_14410 [Bacteroidota bacterium]
MKKNYLYLVLIFLIGVACNKGTVDLSTKENTLSGYSVEGIYDLTLSSLSSINTGKEKLRLSISNDNDAHENLKVSLQGVPEYVSTSITPAEGVVPFQTEIVFTLTGTPKPGKYPVKFVLTDANGRTKISIINLTIPIVNFDMAIYEPGDFYIYNNGITDYVNSIRANSFGIAEPIHLSFSNLPEGAEGIFSNNNSTSITAGISFHATNVKNGTYPILLNAKTTSGISQSYATNLVVSSNCAKSLVDEKFSKMLRYEDGKLIDSVWADVRLDQVTNKVNRVEFRGSNLSPYQFNYFWFLLNCDNQTIELGKQHVTVASVTYNNVVGKGYYDLTTKQIVIECDLGDGKQTKFVIAK